MLSNKFYTWIDVQDKLDGYFDSTEANDWLENISFRAYWDGLTITFALPKTREDICEKLSDIFKLRFQEEAHEVYLILENSKKFPIFFEEVEQDEINESIIKPSLSRKSFIAPKQSFKNHGSPLTNPTFFAFHSFKGGVGRTLHSIAFALQLAEKGKVLLIDADFEAPGITWLIENREIALADFLAMIHGTKDHTGVINYTAKVLKEATDNENLFVLPAFRELSEKVSSALEIKPEHIFKFSKDPFILSDIIEQLGIALGVDYIVMDLRAGMSELSTGWLLDPRINKVFVTTLSSQSLLGTAMMFRVLSRFEAKNNMPHQNNPFLIVSQIPKASLKEISSGWTSDTGSESTLKSLRDAYAESFINIEEYKKAYSDLTDEQILAHVLEPNALFSEEYDSLKFLPDNWVAVCESIRNVDLDKQMSVLTNFLPLNVKNETESFTESRQKLIDFSENMIFAEKQDINDFLTTESIRNLANRYRTQIPITVIVGVKGSGKTFLYKQIRRLDNWKNFVEKVIGKIPNNNALIFPVTIPSSLGENQDFIHVPSDIKAYIAYEGSNIWLEYIKPDIETTLQTNLTVSAWRDKWLDYMAWSTGYEVGKPKVGKNFMKFLETKKIKMVGIFDGLEELFREFNTNLQQQNALIALLQDVPNWLESQPEKYLGITVFVRQDMVSAAITQNSGQFLDKYKDFELKWNIEEVLRLVNWILIKSNILNNNKITLETLSQVNENELISSLYKLWGMKMAKDTSKEASSLNWVLGSLANLKKEIQSRDIVRFLSIAAENSKKDANSPYNNSYDDRILFPTSIKQAIAEVGSLKIGEVKKENEPLKKVLEKLEEKVNDIGFPSKVITIKNIINDNDIKILEDNGVMMLYNGEYYMAEIYRNGMGFTYSRRGKPKVLYV